MAGKDQDNDITIAGSRGADGLPGGDAPNGTPDGANGADGTYSKFKTPHCTPPKNGEPGTNAPVNGCDGNVGGAGGTAPEVVMKIGTLDLSSILTVGSIGGTGGAGGGGGRGGDGAAGGDAGAADPKCSGDPPATGGHGGDGSDGGEGGLAGRGGDGGTLLIEYRDSNLIRPIAATSTGGKGGDGSPGGGGGEGGPGGLNGKVPGQPQDYAPQGENGTPGDSRPGGAPGGPGSATVTKTGA